jgi:hypothetical protein
MPRFMVNGNAFFDSLILNFPYGYPPCHWELDNQGPEGLLRERTFERC